MKRNKFVVLLVLLSTLLPLPAKTVSSFSIAGLFDNTSNFTLFKRVHEHFSDFDVLEKSEKLYNAIKNSKLTEFSSSFIAKNGLIFVKANLNGYMESFLLDSGLGTDLILNSDAKNIDNLNSSDIFINGMGGQKNKEMETSRISGFKWNGVEISESDIAAMSLSHLGNDVAGIIGFNTLKKYILTFDYQKSILKAAVKKDLAKETLDNGKLIETIPFQLKDQIPVFDIQINGKTYKVGLDTGASTNVMNEKYFNDFSNSVSNIKDGSMKGFGGICTVKRGVINETKIGDLSYNNMNYMFDSASLDKLNKVYKYDVDGLLGYEFLKKYITVVDFDSKEMRIYDGKTLLSN